ncbi:hypothetical protein PAPYR_8145 [Paratrimastix pyriformis]|uniref:F-box domain-containing protein n=1 Tax=Paratrimastix pyriformis TaxID=342808 RepID=A0ABQ8UBA8_9EUKA|nr:hypothetical protein PAPYR_8145 [Paratrimastix pyriformis]
MIGDIPDHLLLYLSEVDASFHLHCVLSAINHRFRSLLTQATRLEWDSRLNQATRPPFAFVLRRCAASLQVLSITGHANDVASIVAAIEAGIGAADADIDAFVEDDLEGVVFPRLRTLNYPRAPLWFLRLCPQLTDLTTSQAAFPTRPSFDQFLHDLPELHSLEARDLPLSYFGLRGQTRHGYSAVVRATAGEGIAVGTPASVRGLTLEQCDLEDLPVLLADWPNLESLRATIPEGAADPLFALLQQIRAPNLHQLGLTFERAFPRRVPILPAALQPFESILTQLTAAVDVRGPLLVLPAGLRVCDLDLQTDLPEVTLDLPRVEQLTLSAPASLVRITLRCPALVTFQAKTQPGMYRQQAQLSCLFTCFVAEHRMPHLRTLVMNDECGIPMRPCPSRLDLDQFWKSELPDFWRVPDLTLSFSPAVGLLRVPPSVKRLVVSTPSAEKPIELDAPQLEELVVMTSSDTTITFSAATRSPHTLSLFGLRPCPANPNCKGRSFQCGHTLERLVIDYEEPPDGPLVIEGCPALRWILCNGPVMIQSQCPFLDRLGLTAPVLYRPPPKMARGKPALNPIKVMVINYALLYPDRPDVLIISCPCIGDALLLRTAKTPNLRPLYAQDLVRIIQQSGAPVRIVLHHCSEFLPLVQTAFLGDLFEAGKRHGLLLAGAIEPDFQESAVLQSFLRAVATGGISSAVEVLKSSRLYTPAAFFFEGSRTPPPAPQPYHYYAHEVRAHFAGVRLGDLEGALERRSHEFVCQCPASTPPRFRLAWACRRCTSECDPIESCIVLPDPKSPLACLPRIRENASRLVESASVPYFCFRCLLNSGSSGDDALPLAECVGCHTRGLRMRSDAIAALPPFDERPPPQLRRLPPFDERPPHSPLPPSDHVTESGGPPPISRSKEGLLRVLCVAINPNPNAEEVLCSA